jgi:hypothetical protein
MKVNSRRMTCEKKNQEPRLGARVQALLEAEDDIPWYKDINKIINLRMPKTPYKNSTCIFDTFISSLLYFFV